MPASASSVSLSGIGALIIDRATSASSIACSSSNDGGGSVDEEGAADFHDDAAGGGEGGHGGLIQLRGLSAVMAVADPGDKH
jgi:hypothetical protein